MIKIRKRELEKSGYDVPILLKCVSLTNIQQLLLEESTILYLIVFENSFSSSTTRVCGKT